MSSDQEVGMTVDDFRLMALSFPETVEQQHMGHPDFRVRGKIFATLGYPSAEWGMVKLTPKLQERLAQAAPDVFVPAKGVWGTRGATTVHLRAARAPVVREAMAAAWVNTAPKTLARQLQRP
jgi:hypothetical protein